MENVTLDYLENLNNSDNNKNDNDLNEYENKKNVPKTSFIDSFNNYDDNSVRRGLSILLQLIGKCKKEYLPNLSIWICMFILFIYPSFIYSKFYAYLEMAVKEGRNYNFNEVFKIALPLLLMELFKACLVILAAYSTYLLHFKINYHMKYSIVKRILTQKPEKNKFSMGEAINSIKEDPSHLLQSIDGSIDLVSKAAYNIIIFYTLFRIDKTLTIILYLPLIAIAFIAKALNNKIIIERKKSRSGSALVSSLLGDLFNNIQSIKVSAKEDKIIDKLEEYSELRRQAMVKDSLIQNLLFNISNNVTGFGTAIILLFMAKKLRNGQLNLGDFAIFNMLLFHATSFFEWIGRFAAKLTQSTVSVDRLFKITGSKDKNFILGINEYSKQKKDLPNELEKVNEPLNTFTIKDLTSTFNGENGVKDINFTLNKGEFVVITGRIGSGKSTLLKTILGIKQRDKGEILYNNKPLYGDNYSLHQPIASYTPQNPMLFSDSIKNNVTLEKNVPENLVKASYEDAILDKDLLGFEKGDETLIGNKGVKLSGGQKQRVAISRMLCQESEIYFLDDVSSALDVDTEIELWNKLRIKNKTIVAISNKHIALDMADKIIVLKHGKIDSIGTKDELLKSSEEFRNIWGV